MRTDEKLHAYLDGELDAAASLELEREMAQNPALRAGHERLRELSAAVREKADYHAAPARFKVRSQKPRAWLLAPAFALVLAAGIALGVFLAQPRDDDSLGAAVVATHVRSTLAGRLIDVASSDQHTVKPWFNGKLAFVPPVKDFADEGFPLVGGRLDVLAGQNVAALVYARRKHFINVFVMPTKEPDTMIHPPGLRQGYQWRHWRRQGMEYCAISDVSDSDIYELAQLLYQ